MLTPSGSKLYKKFKFKVLKNKKYNILKKKLDSIVKKMKYEEKHNFPNGDLWDDLQIQEYEIEEELRTTWETKKIII